MNWATFIGGLVGAIVAAFTVINTLANCKIPQGHLGFKCRNGKPVHVKRRRALRKHAADLVEINTPQFQGHVRLRRPGYVWGIPYVHTVSHDMVWSRAVEADPQVIRLGNNTAWLVKVGMTLNVRGSQNGIFKALFDSGNDFDRQMRLRLAAETLIYLSLLKRRGDIEKRQAKLRQRMERRLAADGYDVEIIVLNFTEFQPTHITQWTDQVPRMTEGRLRQALAILEERHPGQFLSQDLLLTIMREEHAGAGMPLTGYQLDSPPSEAPEQEFQTPAA